MTIHTWLGTTRNTFRSRPLFAIVIMVIASTGKTAHSHVIPYSDLYCPTRTNEAQKWSMTEPPIFRRTGILGILPDRGHCNEKYELDSRVKTGVINETDPLERTSVHKKNANANEHAESKVVVEARCLMSDVRARASVEERELEGVVGEEAFSQADEDVNADTKNLLETVATGP
ncbi:hypothetical protein F5148DRAFT_1148271 [Russula earlei]|uniref:Uncharacterized protein n=1 Tax=Russula earlei TaxID=71964 RepID=A0ACC0UEF3_9AGAM|nr:hypothetical protein F5148DRAFT_1148271 [Russula earlei]